MLKPDSLHANRRVIFPGGGHITQSMGQNTSSQWSAKKLKYDILRQTSKTWALSNKLMGIAEQELSLNVPMPNQTMCMNSYLNDGTHSLSYNTFFTNCTFDKS